MKKISLIMAFIFLFIGICPTYAFANEVSIMPMNHKISTMHLVHAL